MNQAEKDLKMFGDFILNPLEKAVLGAAIISLGRREVRETSKPAKKAEMQSALRSFTGELKKNEELTEFFELFDYTRTTTDSDLQAHAKRLTQKNKKLLILIELFFASPFPGTKHSPKDKRRKRFIEWLAGVFGLQESEYKELLKAYKGTLNTHMGRRTKIGIGVVVGLAVGAAGGWALAPAIGGALGGGAGLAGAAAVSHGLALLGGGALAAGGAGMAGGIALVTAMGAGVGGLMGLGGLALLTESGAAQVKVDTMKLQMVLGKIIIGEQKDMAKAQEIILRHEEELKRLQTKLVQLQGNESANKDKIKSLKAIIKTLERALKWERKQAS